MLIWTQAEQQWAQEGTVREIEGVQAFRFQQVLCSPLPLFFRQCSEILQREREHKILSRSDHLQDLTILHTKRRAQAFVTLEKLSQAALQERSIQIPAEL